MKNRPMKIKLSLSLLGILFAGSVAERCVLSQIKKPSQVLFDFRIERPVSSSKIPPATQRAVLSKVFRKYLTDPNKCNPRFVASSGSDPLHAARLAGQIAPAIADMATGSFTAPGKAETLYVISVNECNASHAENFGTKRVAIFSGQQLVTDVDVDYKIAIQRKTDLNGDGIDELLMTSGDMNQGTLTEMGALMSFQNGRVRVIEDLGTVTEDSCASLIPGSSAKAAVVSLVNVSPGIMPKLRIDNYESGCRKAKRWRFVSSGKM
jgi:hypothetical protein